MTLAYVFYDSGLTTAIDTVRVFQKKRWVNSVYIALKYTTWIDAGQFKRCQYKIGIFFHLSALKV